MATGPIRDNLVWGCSGLGRKPYVRALVARSTGRDGRGRVHRRRWPSRMDDQPRRWQFGSTQVTSLRNATTTVLVLG